MVTEPCLPVGIPGLIPTGNYLRAAWHKDHYRFYVGGKWVYSSVRHDDLWRLVAAWR